MISTQPQILPHTTYRATVKLRRGDGFVVRPECEEDDGKDVVLSSGWKFEDGEREQYRGEWAMVDNSRQLGVAWIASGDLIDMQEVAP